MNHKPSLKELQQRLTERLQAAQEQPALMAWLAVLAGGQPYLLPLAQAGEIFALPNIVPVPYTQPWFRGVTNLRGSLYSVIDLASFIAGNSAAACSEPVPSYASLVAVNTESGVNCALLLDTLSGLRHQEAFGQLQPAAPDAPAWFGQRLIDRQGQPWQELDLYALTQTPAFLNIGV